MAAGIHGYSPRLSISLDNLQKMNGLEVDQFMKLKDGANLDMIPGDDLSYDPAAPDSVNRGLELDGLQLQRKGKVPSSRLDKGLGS